MVLLDQQDKWQSLWLGLMYVRLVFRRSRDGSSGPVTFFHGDWFISTAILSLPLIQIVQLAVTFEKLCTKGPFAQT